MSLLDDARRLVEAEPIVPAQDEYDEPACVYCDGNQVLGSRLRVTHQPDCPWLSLPKIIAALEAAENATRAWSEAYPEDRAPSYDIACAMIDLEAALDADRDVTS